MSRIARGELVIGGLYIPASGTLNLYDWISETDTGQDLADQAYQATPTLYIPMHPAVKCFKIIGYRYGYVDGAGADQWTNTFLFEGAVADDDANQRKTIPITIGSLAETALTASGTYTAINPNVPIRLDTAGKLYFMTTWGTIISCGAGEHWFLVIYAESMEDSM